MREGGAVTWGLGCEHVHPMYGETGTGTGSGSLSSCQQEGEDSRAAAAQGGMPESGREKDRMDASATEAGGSGRRAPLEGSSEKGRDEKKRKESQEANPFRNLGSALERWKANLNVTGDAGEEGAGGDEEKEPEQEQEEEVFGEEYEFGKEGEKKGMQTMAEVREEETETTVEGIRDGNALSRRAKGLLDVLMSCARPGRLSAGCDPRDNKPFPCKSSLPERLTEGLKHWADSGGESHLPLVSRRRRRSRRPRWTP